MRKEYQTHWQCFQMHVRWDCGTGHSSKVVWISHQAPAARRDELRGDAFKLVTNKQPSLSSFPRLLPSVNYPRATNVIANLQPSGFVAISMNQQHEITQHTGKFLCSERSNFYLLILAKEQPIHAPRIPFKLS
jgi:hypothetical protein